MEDPVSSRRQAVIFACNFVLLTTRELLDLYFELLQWNISAFKMWYAVWLQRPFSVYALFVQSFVRFSKSQKEIAHITSFATFNCQPLVLLSDLKYPLAFEKQHWKEKSYSSRDWLKNIIPQKNAPTVTFPSLNPLT